MSITINGSGSITGLVSGGLPDGSVTAADIESSLDLSGKTVTLPAGTGGKVLQVVSTTKTDTASFTSNSTNTFVDISGMSVTITPTSATSKILIIFTIQVSQNAAASIHVRLMRDSTAISVGDAAGSRLQDTVFTRPSANPYQFDSQNLAANFLDSPSTTSATTYKLQATLGASYSGPFYLNRVQVDNDSDYTTRTASTITAMEIAG
jgi:hypothetical protein